MTRVGLIYWWANDSKSVSFTGGLMTVRVGLIYWWANDSKGGSHLLVG